MPKEVRAEKQELVEQGVRLVHAMLDVLASASEESHQPGGSGNLKPAILCMELS